MFFSDAAKKLLKTHSWPGNVRELDNAVQRSLILKAGNIIEDKDIQLEGKVTNAQFVTDDANKANDVESGLSGDLRAHEQDLIISALQARNSRKEVAERLGISSRTLRYKLAKMRDAGVTIPA